MLLCHLCRCCCPAVNTPGTYYQLNATGSPTAITCPQDSYSPGLRKQRACVPCAPGFTTADLSAQRSSQACGECRLSGTEWGVCAAGEPVVGPHMQDHRSVLHSSSCCCRMWSRAPDCPGPGLLQSLGSIAGCGAMFTWHLLRCSACSRSHGVLCFAAAADLQLFLRATFSKALARQRPAHEASGKLGLAWLGPVSAAPPVSPHLQKAQLLKQPARWSCPPSTPLLLRAALSRQRRSALRSSGELYLCWGSTRVDASAMRTQPPTLSSVLCHHGRTALHSLRQLTAGFVMFSAADSSYRCHHVFCADQHQYLHAGMNDSEMLLGG